jgi:hypothetical protein
MGLKLLVEEEVEELVDTAELFAAKDEEVELEVDEVVEFDEAAPM